MADPRKQETAPMGYQIRQHVRFGPARKLTSKHRNAWGILLAFAAAALLWWLFYAIGDIFL